MGRALERIQLYLCTHQGVDNVWADLPGRWSAPVVIRRLVKILPSHLLSPMILNGRLRSS